LGLELRRAGDIVRRRFFVRLPACGRAGWTDQRGRLLNSSDLVVELALHPIVATAVEDLKLAAKQIGGERTRGRNG
jgi:hypothetical protein